MARIGRPKNRMKQGDRKTLIEETEIEDQEHGLTQVRNI